MGQDGMEWNVLEEQLKNKAFDMALSKCFHKLSLKKKSLSV